MHSTLSKKDTWVLRTHSPSHKLVAYPYHADQPQYSFRLTTSFLAAATQAHPCAASISLIWQELLCQVRCKNEVLA